MKPHYRDNHITLYNHDCRDMSELPDNSVQMVVTSPPYWGLRKYSGEQDLIWGGGDKDCEHEWVSHLKKWHGDRGTRAKLECKEVFDDTFQVEGTATNFCSLCGAWKGAFGLEPTPEMYVEHTIEIFEEVKRVLRKDGVCFFNIGDSYYASGGAHKPEHANPGLSKSAERGGVPHGGQSGKHGKALSDSVMSDFFSQNPCGECVKTLLNRNPDKYDYPSVALAISGVLSNHSHKAQRLGHSDNSHLTSQGGHNEGETLGPCSFAGFLDGVVHGVQESTNLVSSDEFPRCPYALNYWNYPSLIGIVLPLLHRSNDGVCPFWLYLLSHGIQGLTASISSTLEIDGASAIRIKDKVYDCSVPYSYYNTPYRLKAKDLCLIPQRLMIAFQNAGWWVRSIIIWNKPNPMPESVTDRPTESHEYILMLTKNKTYYWDQEAVREPWKPNEYDKARAIDGGYRYQGKHQDGYDVSVSRNDHLNAHCTGQPIGDPLKGRNLRSVWSFPTTPFPEAHFAVFPEKLPEMCIKAATPEVGCCAECGAPWTRVLSKGFTAHDGESKTAFSNEEGHNANQLAKLRQAARARGGEYVNIAKTIGWQPTCKCGKYTCVNCQSVVLYPYREVRDATQRPRGEEGISSGVGKEEVSEQRGNQGTDKGSSSEIPEDLRPLREGIQRQKRQPILQSGLLNEVDVGARTGQHGNEEQEMGFASSQDTDQSRLYQDKNARTPASGQSGLCMGTPISNGENTGKIPDERGAGASQERNKERQQTREPSESSEGAYRSSMPSMPTHLPDKKTCPNCGSLGFNFEPTDKVPSIVLDPFAGAGTTLYVAKRLNRKAIGFDTSEEYCQLAAKRNWQQVIL